MVLRVQLKQNTMLKLKDYTKDEIAPLIKCAGDDVQAMRRKLPKYGVDFTYDRRTQIFTITDTGDQFK